MFNARSETTINRPADEIWAYAAQISRHPEWMAVLSAEALRGTGTRVGDRGRERMRVGPFTVNAEFTVVESESPRRIVWRPTRGSPVRGDLALELEPLGPSTTRATYGGSFTMRGALRLLEPLLAGEARREQATELRRLKEAVEATSASIAAET